MLVELLQFGQTFHSVATENLCLGEATFQQPRKCAVSVVLDGYTEDLCLVVKLCVC